VRNKIEAREAWPGVIRLYFYYCNQRFYIIHRMRPYSNPITSSMVIIEILKSVLLRLLIPSIFSQDISNWVIKSVVFNNPYLMLLSPRLQLVCLGRGLVGYWRGYFNHKRCRRRCIFKLRRYEFLYILNPKRTHLIFILNKVFDLLRECGLCYCNLYYLSYIKFRPILYIGDLEWAVYEHIFKL